MRSIVFDSETTGLRPGNICQLAYIIVDGGAPKGRNFFFKVDYIEPGAINVHGYTVEMIDRLSGGRRFGESAGTIYDDFKSCPLWIAHNFSFDNLFIYTEFKRAGMYIKAENSFCTMRHFTQIMQLKPVSQNRAAGQFKYPSLSELIKYVNLSDKEIYDMIFEAFGGDGAGLNRHDARYDCAATYLCYKKGAASGPAPDRDFPRAPRPAIDNM